MEPANVTAIFVKDHERINALFQDLKQAKHKNPGRTVKILRQLRSSLEKHFKEEELLYSKYKLATGELLPVIQTIKNEHKAFLESLDKINIALKNNSAKIDTFDIYHLLIRHKNIEERLLYPELDNVLSDKEKEDVYWNIGVK